MFSPQKFFKKAIFVLFLTKKKSCLKGNLYFKESIMTFIDLPLTH